jgi:two-component system OmpR family response regulator
MSTVLVVDDEQPIRLLCRVTLELAGYDVVEAPSGAAALEAAHRLPIDLAVLDVMLPEMDGWEIARALREGEETAAIPFVFLTARNTPADRARARALGAVGYLGKPFDPPELTNVVRTVLAQP